MSAKKGQGNTIRLPAGYYTMGALALKVGVSRDTIKRWTKDGFITVRKFKRGKLSISGFGDEAVIQALQLKNGTGPLSERLPKMVA